MPFRWNFLSDLSIFFYKQVMPMAFRFHRDDKFIEKQAPGYNKVPQV